MKALLIISHGSRSVQAVEEVVALAQALKSQSRFDLVGHAFLDVAQPDIPTALRSCVQKGAREIVVLPHFLNSGKHVLNDVPDFIARARKDHPEVRFEVLAAVGLRPHFVDLCLDILRE